MIEHIKRHSRKVVSYGSVAIAASAIGAAAAPWLDKPLPILSSQRVEYRLAAEGESGERPLGDPAAEPPRGDMPPGPSDRRPEDRGPMGNPADGPGMRPPFSERDGQDDQNRNELRGDNRGGMPGPGFGDMRPRGDDRGPSPDMMNERRGDPGRGSGMMNEEQQKQWEEMEKKQEEERKAMEARQLQQIKRGLAQAKRGLTMMKKMFDKAAAKGTPIPADCQSALKAAETALQAAEKAETMEEMQEANAEDLHDHFETLNECRMVIEKIMRAQQIVKRLDRDLKSIERRWNRAKRSPTSEMQETVNEGDEIIKQIKDKRASLDALLKDGKIDDFEDTLEDDVYGRFDDLDTVMRHLEAIRNSKRFIKEYTQRLRQAEQMVAKLKRLKRDTSTLEELLTKAKVRYEGLKALKPGTEEFDEALRELFDIEQEFSLEFDGDQDFKSELEKPSLGQKPEELRFEF